MDGDDTRVRSDAAVLVPFGVVKDEGFILILALLLRGLFFPFHPQLFLGVLVESAPRDIVPLSDVGSGVEDGSELVLLLLFLLILPLPLLLGVDIGQEDCECVGLSALAAAA